MRHTSGKQDWVLFVQQLLQAVQRHQLGSECMECGWWRHLHNLGSVPCWVASSCTCWQHSLLAALLGSAHYKCTSPKLASIQVASSSCKPVTPS